MARFIVDSDGQVKDNGKEIPQGSPSPNSTQTQPPLYPSLENGTDTVNMIGVIFFAIIALPILGFVYAYTIWYIPFIYINFILAATFGYALGYVNSKFGLLWGSIASVMALYFHWCIWVDLVVNASDKFGPVVVSKTDSLHLILLVLNPSILLKLISEINSQGIWEIFSLRVSGFMLAIVWLIETLIILIGSAIAIKSDDE